MHPRPLLPGLAGLGIATASLLAAPGPGLATLLPAGPGRPPQTIAQGDATFSGVRALNLARNHAVKLNGGLGVYRPAACMFSTEWSGSECLVRRDATGFLFRFLGGPPGWEQLNLAPTVETEILIAPDGRAVVQLLYNGAPRQAGGPGPSARPGTEPGPAPDPAPDPASSADPGVAPSPIPAAPPAPAPGLELPPAPSAPGVAPSPGG